MRYLCLLACAFVATSCAGAVPAGTRVPFTVHGKVVTADGVPVRGAQVHLSEERSRLFPLLIAESPLLGRAVTQSDGSFTIAVTKPLEVPRLSLFVLGRTYLLAGTELPSKYTEKSDSIYTRHVRVPGPNILRVRRDFVPGTGRSSDVVTVQTLPRF